MCASIVAPSVVAESNQVDFKDGGRLVLSCRAEGHPPPEIVWSFNDVPIPRESEIQGGSSRITIMDEFIVSACEITPFADLHTIQFKTNKKLYLSC